ncbi:MAG: hypothetical protein CI953_820 [Methanohalophilus sp.]|nr:MAG: hypothetical protein CI953_820 [Methanohalophilus sp.]
MSSKTILIAVVAVFLVLSAIGLIFGEPEQEGPTEKEQIEQYTREYLATNNISYTGVEYHENSMSIVVFVDPYEITTQQAEDLVYDATNYLQKETGGNDVVYTRIYETQTQRELVVGQYDPVFEEIEVEYKELE